VSILLTVAIAIHSINPALPEPTAREYAAEVVRQGDLDPWLLVEIIHRETHWIPDLVRHEQDGSCSVGLGQINGSCLQAFVTPLLDPHANIRRVADVLRWLRGHCRTRCEALGWVRSYNPGSRTYGAAIIKAVQKRHGKR